MEYAVTNVRVETEMLRSIKRLALERGVPASVIIREALQRYLSSPEMSKAEWEQAKADLIRVCGIGRGNVTTGSTDIDEVLYGPRRPRRTL
jgi:predicted transcriptional regulator